MFPLFRSRKAIRGQRPRRAPVLRLEILEGRSIPATGAFLQGVTFLDANLNGTLDPGESTQAGATVTLYLKGQVAPLAAITTDATGRYQFDDTNVPGGLAPGTYDLVETPPAGYRNVGARAISQINPMTVVDSKTIEVTIVDPSSLQLTFDPAAFFARNKWEYISYTFEGAARSNTVGQFPITITGTGLGAGGVQFLSLCTDLAHDLSSTAQTYAVLPSPLPPPPADPASAGRIGYLFNHYGMSDLSETDAVGLQLAIWRLEYGAGFGGAAAIAPFTTADQLAAAQARADFFVADSVGKSEPVTFLTLVDGLSSGQGMLASSSSNFGNAPKAIPSVVTQASATAGGLVGISLMGDTATITGGLSLGGTLTFTVTAPDGTTIIVGSVAVSGAGTYAAPATLLATLVGTYTWHASYSGDANNNVAVDNGVNESVKIIKGNIGGFAIPSLVTHIGSTSGVAVGSGRLGDTATISGGLNPTGTITFTLTAPDGTTVATETVQVHGNGNYKAPTSVMITQVGTYTWHAVYSGDASNAAVADDGVNESIVTIAAASKRSLLASSLAAQRLNANAKTPAHQPSLAPKPASHRIASHVAAQKAAQGRHG